MQELANKSIINITGINTVNIINFENYTDRPGEFRFVSKCKAGWMTVSEASPVDNTIYYETPAHILNRFKKGALHTVEYKPWASDYWFTVFAKKGTKIILMDEAIMATLEVATINDLWSNTNMYDQEQYKAVNAKTWADLAFVPNL
jgi:hypothetical protein